jgi:hypothetical protein
MANLDKLKGVHDDGRVVWAATDRNKDPILEVLTEVLPEAGVLLEIAAGTGQHAAHFAERFPGLTWHPTEFDKELHASIDAWCKDLENVRGAVFLDTTADAWPVEEANAVYVCNMTHIAPWEATLGLLEGASRVLSAGGPLAVYGPFMRGGEHNSEGNAKFDVSLKERDASWGLRDIDVIEEEAKARGLVLDRVVEMPANNRTLILIKR